MPRGPAENLGDLGERVPEDVVQDERHRSAGVIDSRTTRKAMATDSSRTIWSAGSAGPVGSAPPAWSHSVRSGSGSGSHAPT